MNFRTATGEATTVMDRRPTTAMAVIDNIAVTGLVNDFINVVVVLPCPILTVFGASTMTVDVAWVATEMLPAETIINRYGKVAIIRLFGARRGSRSGLRPRPRSVFEKPVTRGLKDKVFSRGPSNR
jgi:hypothetical protein